MPGRPPLSRRLLVALAVLTTAACTADTPAPPATGPVDVPLQATSVPDSVRASCAALLAALPDEIDPGVRRRPVTGEADRVAAWGDPAVTLECGVPEPDRPDQPAQVNGVTWSVRDIGAGFRWTTSEFGVFVAVDIPDAYESGAELVNPLAGPLQATLPLVGLG
ncbi:MAG: DUF3515 family protein [Mycobacteriales bacterium]